MHLPGSPRPRLRCHAFATDLPSHGTAAPWLCRTSLCCLWSVCVWGVVGACVCVSDVVLSSPCYARVVGGTDRQVGGGLQGPPRCMLGTVQLGFQVTERVWGSFLSCCWFCPALPQLLGRLTPSLWPEATAGLPLPALLPRQAAACLPRTSSLSSWVIFLPVIHFRDLEADSRPLRRERCPPRGVEGQSWGEAGAQTATSWLLCPGQGVVGTIPDLNIRGLGWKQWVPQGRGEVLLGWRQLLAEKGPASARDQTRVRRPQLGGAACAAGEGRPWAGRPPARAKMCLRPANLQSRQLGWGAPHWGPRATWLPTGCPQHPCRDIPGSQATVAVLPALLSPEPHVSPVRPLSPPPRPLYHHSPPG